MKNILSKNIFGPVIFALLFLFTSDSLAQLQVKNSRELIEANKIKTANEYTGHYISGIPSFDSEPIFITRYDIHGNVTEEIIRHADGYVSAIRRYDWVGNLTEDIYYKPDGSIDSGSTRSFSYKYDHTRKMISKIESGADGSVYIDYAYQYDSEGRLTQEKCSGCPEKTFIYNGEGKLSEESYSGYHTFYKYNTSGYLSESITYQGPREDGLVIHRSTYKYDADGRKLEEIDYDHRGATERKITYSLDSNGYVIGEQGFYSNIDYRCEYKYDPRGLLIERIDYGESDKPVSVTGYVYELYVKW